MASVQEEPKTGLEEHIFFLALSGWFSVMNSFILDRERYAALNHTLSLITFTCKSLFFFFAVSNAAHHIHQENTDICNKLWTFHSVLHVVIFVLSFFSFLKAGDVTFNRAKLLNIGYLEALKDYNWDCFIFHDVDLVPENDHNLYVCDMQPKHLVVGRNVTGYR